MLDVCQLLVPKDFIRRQIQYCEHLIKNTLFVVAISLDPNGFNRNPSSYRPILVWRPQKGYMQLANSADPDQTPPNAASDQGLHWLQIA